MLESFTDAEEKIYLGKMAGLHDQIGRFFDDLVRLDKNLALHDSATQELRARIFSRSFVDADQQHHNALDLLKTADEEIMHENNLAHLYSNIVFGLLALLILFFALIIIRNITWPLTRLYEGVEIIAGGNLDHKTDIRTSDEIGRLSTAFDDMVKNLKKITVSREELIKEIEKHKQTHAALQESDEKYKILTESSQTGIYIHQDEIIVYVNNRFAELHGYTIQELLNTNYFELLHPDDREMALEFKTKRLQGEDVSNNYDVRRIRKDGKTFWGHTAAVRIQYRGKPAIMGNIADISGRKLAEVELATEHERLLVTLRSIGDGVITTDIMGNIVIVNSVAENLTGWTQEEAFGKPLEEVFNIRDGKTNQVRENPAHKALQVGKVIRLANDTILISKDGIVRIVSDSGAPIIDTQGNIIGVVLVFRDITDKVKIEEELIRNEKLESVGVLAGGIAHDFNNILTVIMGNISLAKNQVASENEIFDLLNEVEMASTRAQTLIRQLSTFAKGGAPLKETASIKDILKESCSFVLRGSISGCEFSIAEKLWPTEVDVGQISQVINNVVINANQAMPKGGIIQIVAKNLIIEDRHGLPLNPGRYIRISIKDQGVGIAKEHLSNIFDPYFTTKQKGSGLGLATTYSIIKKHDGHITVESRLGVGSTFHIYLPASEKALPEKDQVRLITGQGKILVMDDEASLRKTVGKMLENLGYEAELAKDGAEAIRMYKEAKESGNPYDAVILDLTIPGAMGGKDTIKQLREIDPEIKAIVSSGYSDDPVMATFKKYGFKGIMPKPFESQLLGNALQKVLKGEKE
ncbi:MAG: PAS domain S-box protein [Desulfatiglandaceae bacterium]